MEDINTNTLRVRRFIVELTDNAGEQYALASSALHHFDLKLRLLQMDHFAGKGSNTHTMTEALKLEDGESIHREFSVTLTPTAPTESLVPTPEVQEG